MGEGENIPTKAKFLEMNYGRTCGRVIKKTIFLIFLCQGSLKIFFPNNEGPLK